MDVKDFLQAYKNIAKSIATQDEIDTLYDSMFYITRGTRLEKNFVDKAANRLDKIISIDDIAHRLHSKEPEILEKLFPGSDRDFVKNKLDKLAGLEVESDVRKYNRDYFTTLASESGLFFISKQVGRTSVDDIGNELEHYKNLYEAQVRDKDGTDLLSNGELATLWRVYKDKKYKSLMNKRGIVDPLVVGGYASVEVIDREGHLITIEALKKAFKEFMKSFRTRNVMLSHSDVQVAFPLPVYVNEKGEVFKSGVDNKGLYLISEVRPDTQIAQKVKEAIEKGELKSYSIAGTATDKEVVTKNGRTYMQVNALDLAEVTLCSKPTNQESNFKMIKCDDKMVNENKLEKMVSENPLNLDDIDDDNFDREALRHSILAEYDAINLYEQIADRTKNDDLKKLMLDVNREEKVHVGEFELLLEQLDKEHSEAIEDGAKEASEIVKSKSEKDKIEDSQDEMDTEELNLPGVSDDNTPDISIGRKVNVDELPEDRQRFVTAGGRKINMSKSKLEVFKEFLVKQGLTPPRPGLVFDRTKHRWVRLEPEEIENRDERLKAFEDMQDKLFMRHPEEVDRIYNFFHRIAGKEPNPAKVVNRFKYEYPDKYEKIMEEK